ncbi:hypothetical protein NLO98_26310 [Pseudomonas syringae]|nr:hypothetical protein [Pseudomonas syringae]
MGAGLGLGGIPTMNDNAVCLTDRGVCIAGKRAPTGITLDVGAGLGLGGIPTMNDNAVCQTGRGV